MRPDQRDQSIAPSWWRTTSETWPWKEWSDAWRERAGSKSSRTAARIVVFTDPDGGLLEHRARPCRPACAALSALAARGIPLVLCSSRTRAQLELIQHGFHFRHPFISENGGAIYLPRGYFSSSPEPAEKSGYEVVAFGGPHQQVVEVLRRTARALDIEVRHFNGMSVQDVADECGLPLAEAQLAQLREYDEPFRVVARDPAVHSRLLNALRHAGLRCVNSGRFHHASFGADMRRSIRTLVTRYRQRSGAIVTVGVSSALGGPSLLSEVDVPIVVLHPEVDSSRVLRKVPTARLTHRSGSAGWDEAILTALEPALRAAPGGRS